MSKERTFLDRATLLGLDDLPIEAVYIPEWRAWVNVRAMTAGQRDQLEADMVKLTSNGRSANEVTVDVNLATLRAKIVVMSVVDEAGEPLFTLEDMTAIASKNAAAIDRIFMVAQRLSGLSDRDVDDLTKNSGSDQSGDSDSA